jgi:Tol biopolymer transport system component
VLIYDCARIDTNPDADENAYEQLKLTDVGSGDEKIIETQLQNCGGLGAAGLEGLFWSPNSRYFYYTDAREGVPDGCGGFWQKPIIRFDIDTSTSEHLGGGPVSPNGTKIAAWQENELIIWDVNEGNETGRISPITLNFESATGPIVWSPDSQALVYIQTESFCPVSGNSSVIYVDLSTLEQEILLESESPTFGSGDWDEKNELILFDANGNQWVYTLDTQKLEPLP